MLRILVRIIACFMRSFGLYGTIIIMVNYTALARISSYIVIVSPVIISCMILFDANIKYIIIGIFGQVFIFVFMLHCVSKIREFQKHINDKKASREEQVRGSGREDQ
jgi:hypothetical protein